MPSSPTSPARRIAIIGGGISGLAAAFRLSQAGHVVTLYESTGQLGGLGTFFEHEGHTFEKFYHCMLPSDGPLLRLLEDLGLTQEIYWKPTTFAYADAGRVYPLNKALDLLRFSPLPFLDRLRVGFTGLWGRMVSAAGLDNITTAQWLEKLSGRRAFQKFWQPMLEAKFGDAWAGVPALWFWTRFNREKGDKKGECKGYIRGGYQRILTTLQQKLEQAGCRIHLNSEVKSMDLNAAGSPVLTVGDVKEEYDQLVITTPWPQFAQAAGPELRAQSAGTDWSIDFQGVINMVLLLKCPISPHYWLATPEERYPFDGIVETSTLTEPADRGHADRHVIYLTKYLHRSDPRFTTADAELRSSWLSALQSLFPTVTEQQVEACYLFRAPFVEPIYTVGFMQRRPPETLIPQRVFLSTTVQVYPTVTSWNGSVGQVEKLMAAMQ